MPASGNDLAMSGKAMLTIVASTKAKKTPSDETARTVPGVGARRRVSRPATPSIALIREPRPEPRRRRSRADSRLRDQRHRANQDWLPAPRERPDGRPPCGLHGVGAAHRHGPHDRLSEARDLRLGAGEVAADGTLEAGDAGPDRL